jgi:hypothetical protein
MQYKKRIQEHVHAAVEQGEWIVDRVGPDVPNAMRNPATGTMDVGAALDLMAKRVENARIIWAEAV